MEITKTHAKIKTRTPLENLQWFHVVAVDKHHPFFIPPVPTPQVCCNAHVYM